jgi:hypothetical protein
MNGSQQREQCKQPNRRQAADGGGGHYVVLAGWQCLVNDVQVPMCLGRDAAQHKTGGELNGMWGCVTS